MSWLLAPPKKPNPNARQLYGQYKKRAKKKKISFDITFEEFIKFVAGDCYICGAPPTQKYIHRYKCSRYTNAPFYYNGIDRVVNEIGYEPGNLMTACGQCNRAKMTQSLADFLEYINKAFNFAIAPYTNSETEALAVNKGSARDEPKINKQDPRKNNKPVARKKK